MRERTRLAGAGRGGAVAGARPGRRPRLRRTGRRGGRRGLARGGPRPARRRIKERAGRAELEALLSGEADGNDAFVEINSGAGGTKSNDWAGMLLRMYTRWANAHGMTVDFLEETAGEQAGIKSVTLQVKGPNAYGWLKTEAGVHRLVRISPFDSAAKRHTSFASVWVYPVVDDNIVIDINPADVRTDTYRASGAGGQHINKTDSAVRLTHIPTGVAVACQTGRSQHQNREEAWKMLRARLYELELQKREAGAAGAGGPEDRHRLGPPDPQLRPAALPDGQGPADRRRDLGHPRRARRRPRPVHGRLPGPARRRDAGRRGGLTGQKSLADQFLQKGRGRVGVVAVLAEALGGLHAESTALMARPRLHGAREVGDGARPGYPLHLAGVGLEHAPLGGEEGAENSGDGPSTVGAVPVPAAHRVHEEEVGDGLQRAAAWGGGGPGAVRTGVADQQACLASRGRGGCQPARGRDPCRAAPTGRSRLTRRARLAPFFVERTARSRAQRTRRPSAPLRPPPRARGWRRSRAGS